MVLLAECNAKVADAAPRPNPTPWLPYHNCYTIDNLQDTEDDDSDDDSDSGDNVIKIGESILDNSYVEC